MGENVKIWIDNAVINTAGKDVMIMLSKNAIINLQQLMNAIRCSQGSRWGNMQRFYARRYALFVSNN